MLTTLTIVFSTLALLISLTAVYVFLRAKDEQTIRDIDLRHAYDPPAAFRPSGHWITPKAEKADPRKQLVIVRHATAPSWMREATWK